MFARTGDPATEGWGNTPGHQGDRANQNDKLAGVCIEFSRQRQ
jgi:hypothetical protein